MDRVISGIATLFALVGIAGLLFFAALQNVRWRGDIENWAARHDVHPVIDIVRLLTD